MRFSILRGRCSVAASALAAVLSGLVACSSGTATAPEEPPVDGLDVREPALSVRVFDPAGRPVAAAGVLVESFRWGREIMTTDADGWARLQDLDPNLPYTVAAEIGGIPPTRAGFRAREDEPRTLHLVLGGVFGARVEGGFPDAPGGPMTLGVSLSNSYDRPLTEVVVHDTLDARELVRPLRSEDVVVDRDRFPDASVTVHPDGFSFSVHLGQLAPTDPAVRLGFVRVYTVTLEPLMAGILLHSMTARARHASGIEIENHEDLGLARPL